MPASITVFIVDDDESVRRAMARLMKAARFQVVCVSGIEELLGLDLPAGDAAMVIDMRTARRYSATLPEPLHTRNMPLPVIYLTDYDTDWTRREAKRMGAAGYFRKPVDDQALVDAILFGNGDATFGPFPKTDRQYEPAVEEFNQFDVEVAKSKLAEAGWVDGGDGDVGHQPRQNPDREQQHDKQHRRVR